MEAKYHSFRRWWNTPQYPNHQLRIWWLTPRAGYCHCFISVHRSHLHPRISWKLLDIRQFDNPFISKPASIYPARKKKGTLDIMNMVVLKSNILYLCGLVYLSTFIFLFENSHWKLILEVIIDSEMAQQRKLAECKMNKLVNLSKVFNFYRTLWGSFIYKKWQSIYYLVVEPTHLKNIN